MKFYNLILISFFLFSSCNPKNIDTGERSRESKNRQNTNIENPSTKNTNSSDYRSTELRRLKAGSSNPVIRSILENRYKNPSSYSYGGATCEDVSSCLGICDDVFSRYSRKCERAPAEFIESLNDNLYKLLNISDLDEVGIDPAFITAIIDFDKDLLIDLIKKNMSEGDLKTFLAWIAVNEKIAEAFSEEYRSRDVLEEAFEKLGEFKNGKKDLETAFNIGLIAEDDTFLSLSAGEGNEEAFVLGYKVLDSSCSKKDCKLYVLCSREQKNRNRRSSVFGFNSRNESLCKTSTRTDGRGGYRTNETCYIQGSNVWSYLEELIDEDDIKDSDFEKNIVTVTMCNQFCGETKDSNTKCSRIL